MDSRGEALEPNFLRVLDHLGVTLAKCLRHRQVPIKFSRGKKYYLQLFFFKASGVSRLISLLMSVDENVEATQAVEQGQEGDAGRDLPDDVADLQLDLLLVLGAGFGHEFA